MRTPGPCSPRAPAGRFPEGLAYVPSTGQVWASDEDGGADTVLVARTGQRVATVPLGGEAGNVGYEPGGDRVLVDVQTDNEIAVIDPHTRTIVLWAPLPDCDHDHGLLVVGGRAFVACDGNDELIPLTLPGLTELAPRRRPRAGRSGRGARPPVAPHRRGVRHGHHVDLRPAPGRVTGRARPTTLTSSPLT